VQGLNQNNTQITVNGIPTVSMLPLNTSLFASNNTTYNGCKINLNLWASNYSFDTSSLSQSITLGYGFRDMQTATSNSNCMSTFYMQNPPKTIQKPNQNFITIQIYNNSNVYNNFTLSNNQLLTNTDYFSNPTADMTSYSMILEFIPISDE
jgi:heme-binding NEAT domain protein